MKRLTAALAVVVAIGGPAMAAEPASPYAGLETRAIKALSAEEVAGLREGKGMSLALAAELNGHPGPLHVLELADGLALDEAQRVRTQATFDRMKAKAMALGEEVLALEGALEAEFQAAEPDAARIEALTARIGERRGALRAAHLVAHLEMNAILRPEQRRRYAELRGYDGQGGHDPAAHGAHGGHDGYDGHGAPRH